MCMGGSELNYPLDIIRLPTVALWYLVQQSIQVNPVLEVLAGDPPYNPLDPDGITPDASVMLTTSGDCTVRVLDDWAQGLRIDSRYTELLDRQDIDPKKRAYIQRKCQASRRLFDAIAARHEVLTQVIQVIAHHQQAFLEAGDEFLQVLSLSLIAEEAQLPETTARMAVEGKWLQVPRGLFALRHLLKGFEAAKNGPPSLN